MTSKGLISVLITVSLCNLLDDKNQFSYVKDGKLCGLVTTHSDDLILAGNEVFEKDISSKLQQVFQFSKIEDSSFKYRG